MKKKEKYRILHVVYAMNLGGIESWLMHLYREVLKDNIQFDFLVFIKQNAVFDDEIRKLGGNILYGGHYKNPFSQIIISSRILKKRNYDAVHIHNIQGAFSIFIASKLAGVENIIFHAHNDYNRKLSTTGFVEKLYLKISKKYLFPRIKTKVAVSQLAGKSYFSNSFYHYIPIGEDFTCYSTKDNMLTKKQFNFSESDIVFTHVGRFFPEKNHRFIVEIFKELVKLNKNNVKLLLVGTGPLQDKIEKQIVDCNLQDKVLILGNRTDIPNILKDLTNVFLFPSLYEGLGLVMVEAQAAGIPVVCSDTLPDEGIVISELVKKVSLNVSAKEWAKITINHFENNREYSKDYALTQILNSQFNIKSSIRSLTELWIKN